MRTNVRQNIAMTSNRRKLIAVLLTIALVVAGGWALGIATLYRSQTAVTIHNHTSTMLTHVSVSDGSRTEWLPAVAVGHPTTHRFRIVGSGPLTMSAGSIPKTWTLKTSVTTGSPKSLVVTVNPDGSVTVVP